MTNATETNVQYWTERYEQCFALADEIERAHRYKTGVRKVAGAYRLAASNWRKAAFRAVSDDPTSRDMVEGNARDGATFEAIAHQKRHDFDGTPIPPAPAAYPPADEPSERVVGRLIGRPVNGLTLGPTIKRATETRQGCEDLYMGHIHSSTLYKADGRWLACYYEHGRGEGDWRELTDDEADEWARSWS